MHYPVLDKDPASQISPHRISPYTDYGSITFLFQQDIGGLLVRPLHYLSLELSNDEVRTNAPVFNDMVLVNIADMMEFWTAGRLKSTWHKVTSNMVEQS